VREGKVLASDGGGAGGEHAVKSLQGRGWIIAGALLDLLGAVLIARNVPEIGAPLVAGVGLLLAGSAIVFQGVLRLPRERAGQAASWPGASQRWSAEPELNTPPPRPVRLTPAGRLIMVLWGMMAAVVTGYVFLAPPRPVSPPPLLEAEGVPATAVVHAKNERALGSGGATYYVSYHFETQDGGQVRESVSVPRSVYDAVAVGDSFEVIYFPFNPQQNFVPRLERRELPAAVRWGAVALLAALFFLFDQQRRFHKRLVSEGKPAAGVVEGLRRRGARRVFTVRYQVQTREGQLRGSERNLNRADGDAVTVLYLPQRPEQVLLYSTAMYRARGE
jgi:hypothetical protein